MFHSVKKIEFTPQELRVIKLICKQLTAREIADKIGLSFRTVEGYRENILRKIGAKNSVGIALFAVKHGIIKLGQAQAN
jgi:DNA-binding NarL/FixJ family response regulator